MNRFLETQKNIMMAYLQGIKQSGLNDMVSSFDLSQIHMQTTPSKESVQPQEPTMKSISPEVDKIESVSTGQEALNKEHLTKELIRITSDKTGYPTEMLNLDLDIEADLGIDSIKRVEILNSFVKCLPGNDQKKIQTSMEDISRLKTLNAILNKTAEIALSEPVKTSSDEEKHLSSKESPVSAKDAEDNEDIIVPRFLLEPFKISNPEEKIQTLNDGIFIITDDERGVATALKKEIKQHGGQVITLKMSSTQTNKNGQTYTANLKYPSVVENLVNEIRRDYNKITGLIHLLPLASSISFDKMNLKTWKERLQVEVKSLFYLAKYMGYDLLDSGKKGGGWLVAATALTEYSNGNGSNGNYFAGQAGIAGLLKTVAQEWTDVRCKAVNLDMTNSPAILSKQLMGEMAAKNGPVEVKYNGLNRIVYRAKLAPLNLKIKGKLRITTNWVILVTGGAVGITAEVACELAAKYQPTLLLVGRSPFPEGEEFNHTAGLTSPKDIKSALIEKSRSNGRNTTPAKVEAEYTRLLKDREIRQNIAKMRKAGATVHYFQADVKNEKIFGSLIDEIYHSFGRLDGVVHGAGIIEDKLFKDKTPDSFDRVFDTKTNSSFVLIRKLRADSLKFIVFFTSVAGCFGNRGQADYAAANEVVNKLAQYLDQHWSGRVLAINWGPWDKTGMVSPETKKQFMERGIQLIPPSVGCHMFEQELRCGNKGDVEVVIGDGPWMI